MLHKGMTGREPIHGDAGPASTDKTLGDYVNRITKSEEIKLTFEEWWCKQGFDTDRFMYRIKHDFNLCWQTAQENK